MIENKPIEYHKWMNRYAFFSLQKYMNNPLGKLNYARNKTKNPWLALQKQLSVGTEQNSRVPNQFRRYIHSGWGTGINMQLKYTKICT